MTILLLILACAGNDVGPTTDAAPTAKDQPAPVGPPPGGGHSPKGPPLGPPPGGPPLGGAPGMLPPLGPAGGGASGAELQDSSGFPGFHDQPAPPGPAITARGAFSEPVQLSSPPGGGYRPQIVAAPGDTLHAVFYERTDDGDLIRHRTSQDGVTWTAPAPVGFDKDRNWGPDLVARDDGSLVLVFDHALPDFTSRGYLTTWRDGRWSDPEPLTGDDGGEVGSGHVANGVEDQLAYVWIGKALSAQHRFRAHWSWFQDGAWSDPVPWTDGTADAWHTNVERRPDGSFLAGFDIGAGGTPTQLHVSDGRDGAFGPMENLTATGKPGERPHFAFGSDGTDHITWFHKESGRPVHVYVRSGRPGSWGPISEPSAGYGGFHFDPEIAINSDGVRCLIWGWDAGQDAEMVYSLDTGSGWSAPQKLADIDWGKPGLASIDVTADGAFHVVWNQGVRGRNEVYYARLAPPR